MKVVDSSLVKFVIWTLKYDTFISYTVKHENKQLNRAHNGHHSNNLFEDNTGVMPTKMCVT